MHGRISGVRIALPVEGFSLPCRQEGLPHRAPTLAHLARVAARLLWCKVPCPLRGSPAAGGWGGGLQGTSCCREDQGPHKCGKVRAWLSGALFSAQGLWAACCLHSLDPPVLLGQPVYQEKPEHWPPRACGHAVPSLTPLRVLLPGPGRRTPCWGCSPAVPPVGCTRLHMGGLPVCSQPAAGGWSGNLALAGERGCDQGLP